MSSDRADTLDTLRRRIARDLRDYHDGDAEIAALEARLLVAHAADQDPARAHMWGAEPADDEVSARVADLLARRLSGVPVDRITGRKEFYGLTLDLSPETLAPRPDTETLVDGVLAWVKAAGRQQDALRILDLGTGSGAILLALLHALPNAKGVGADVSEDALKTAEASAVRLGLSGRASFTRSDWAASISGTFDVVVSNPPYIASGEIAGLQREVRDHDPRTALDGGEDGLVAYGRIIPDLGRLLVPAGVAFLEIGAEQASGVCALSEASGFATVVHRDLGGRDRVVEMQREQDSLAARGRG